MTTTSESLSIASGWSRAFRALRHRNFRLYWSGQIVSQVGIWMQVVAQSWVVYRLTDSPFMLGLVNFAALLPVVPISLLGGVISDRFPRRTLIILTESIMTVQAIVMAFLIWLNMIQVWHIILLSFILGAASALEQPARLAFVLDVVGQNDLSNAVAVSSSAYNTARIIGPSIAGLLIASVGEAACFLINGVTYLGVILALLIIRLPPQTVHSADQKLMGSLVNGLKYTWDNRVIRGLMLIVALASFLTIPYIALMPVFAKDVLHAGPDVLGFLLTAVGIGAILGGLIVACLQEGRRGLWLVLFNVIGSVFLLIFCISGSIPLSMVFVMLLGSSNAIRQTLANSLIQLNTAEAYHGRVMSVFNLLLNGMSRVGALLIGAMAEFINAPIALGLSALLGVIFGLFILYRMPVLRRLR